MNTFLLLISFLFLCNPQISTVDLLPDTVGYLFLFLALTRSAYVSTRLHEARHVAGILCLATAPKVLFGVGYLLGNASTVFGDKTLSLTVTFLYAFVEVYLCSRLFSLFLDGISDVGMLGGSRAVDRKSAVLRRRSVVFLIVRAIGALLPELVYLASLDYLDYDIAGIYMDVRLAHPYLAALSVILVLPFALVWFLSLVRYWRGVRREGIFDAVLKEQTVQKADAIALQRRGAVFLTGLVLVFLGFFCFLSVSIDYVPQPFRPFGAVFVLLGLRTLRHEMPPTRRTLALGIVAAVGSLANAVFSTWYYQTVYELWGTSFGTLVSMGDDKRHQMLLQWLLAGTTLAECVLCGLFFCAVFRFFRRMVSASSGGEASLRAVMDARLSFENERKRAAAYPLILLCLSMIYLLLIAVGEIPRFALYGNALPWFRFCLGAVLLLLFGGRLLTLFSAQKERLRL